MVLNGGTRLTHLEIAQFVGDNAHGKRCENGEYRVDAVDDGRLGHCDAQ